MKLLLDTHTFLWFVNGDTAISDTARETIEAYGNVRYLSMASVWEIGIKLSLGKLKLSVPLDNLIAQSIELNDFALLPISVDHVVKVSSLQFHHRDPFDRMIAAQALADNLVVISRDHSFDLYGCQRIW